MDYQKRVKDFLAKCGVTFTVELIGNDCPPFCEDAANNIDIDKVNTFPRRTHIHGKHYRATLSRNKSGTDMFVVFDFWNSYADEEQNNILARRSQWCSMSYRLTDQYRGKQPTKVTAYDVLACITKDHPGTFEEFCSDFGCDTDSRKAEDTYRAVCGEWRKVSRFFTPEELAELREIQ